MIYIIKWAIALTLLYSLYGLTLRRETFHHLNRAVLVCILLASAVLPLCHLRLGQSTWLSESFRRLEQQLPSFTEARLTEEAALLGVSSDGSQDFQSFHHDGTIIPSSSNDYSIMMEQSESLRGEGEISGLGASEEQGERGSWLVLALMAAYVLGAVLGLLSYLRSLVRVARLIHRSKLLEVRDGVRILLCPQLQNSCSWMRWVMSPLPEEGAILLHELAHVRLGHSWDKMLAEVTCRLLWFLPFAWMLREDLCDVHEFEADRAVLQTGIDIREYNQLLILKAVRPGLQPVVNAFNQSRIKKRITMMFKPKSTKWRAAKGLYLLPVTMLTLVAFARPQALSEIEEKIEEAAYLADGSPEEVLDSIMQAIGAKRIGEAVYVGRFKPNYTSDTIRVHKIHLNDSLNRHTASEEFSGNEKNGYVVQLQPEDREELGSRYHIRFMDEEHPVRSNPEVTGKVTGKATGRYDLRPANPAPVIERPAWPNYDVNNENSFAVFTDVNTVVGSGGRHLVSNSSYAKDALSSGSYTLYRCRDATYLACDYYDWQDWIFFCFSSKSALIDPDTGNRYRVRSLEHFPLDQCFWVHGQEGETLRFVGVFPPLPRNVKRVQLYIGTSKSRQWFNGSSELYEPVKVKDLRPSKTQQQARIIQ